MDTMQWFMPCAAGAQAFLADEVRAIVGSSAGATVQELRAGVLASGPWEMGMRLNLHSRMAQRVLVQLSLTPYACEDDIYAAASAVAWEAWFTPQQRFRIDITAQRSPLKSVNFAALRVKDAVADRFRARCGARPSVDTQEPDARIFVHLTHAEATLYIDTSGQALFKRGWREQKGQAPLKETLAATMIAASGWQPHGEQPLYDPCCGSGTIAIEAAQMACCIAPGSQRRFGFERLLPHQPANWQRLRQAARDAVRTPSGLYVFGSDVAHRMVDFAQRNAQRAGVSHALQLRGGDALQRLPPTDAPGILLLNPPYGERIAPAGVAGARERAIVQDAPNDASADFFTQLAAHWKAHYANWSAWLLSPDMQLPRRMHLQAARRVPLYNGPLECRLWRFDMVAGSARRSKPSA